MSVASERGTIELGGRAFDVSAFTFDQLQVMLPLFDRLNLKEPITAASDVKHDTIETCRDIIKAAIGDQVAPDGFGDIKTNLVEMFTAVGKIANTSGLVEVGEAVRGMAKPSAS